MTQSPPVGPPQELVNQWLDEMSDRLTGYQSFHFIATKAAEWQKALDAGLLREIARAQSSDRDKGIFEYAADKVEEQ